jgi:hypothetical protein
MIQKLEALEHDRLRRQSILDAHKTQAERNRLGQFATPPELAQDIVELTYAYLPPSANVHFLDPAFGTGAFYSALLQSVPASRIGSAQGFEIDPYYGLPAAELWQETPLKLHLKDFTAATAPANPDAKVNLLICNPPYVRHHHLQSDNKARLYELVRQRTGKRLSGLTGLYCYFMLLADAWLAENGIACWLIPSEFLDVNYGKQVKEYLCEQVTLLRIHRFDPESVQFRDALVSSVVVWFQNRQPSPNHVVQFTYGDNLRRPQKIRHLAQESLIPTSKWTQLFEEKLEATRIGQTALVRVRLGELFEIKRGIATGANEFFILTEAEAQQRGLPTEFLKPILPSPRYLTTDHIRADAVGLPMLDKRLFLLDCQVPEARLRKLHPAVWKYLQLGVDRGINERYLCRHRSPWYAQEQRPPAPIICTYMGRQITSRNELPFRFILNESRATAANVYLLLYPKPQLRESLKHEPKLLYQIWQSLSRISAKDLIASGRTYGGKLHKLEPKELENLRLDFALVPPSLQTAPAPFEQMQLLESKTTYSTSENSE